MKNDSIVRKQMMLYMATIAIFVAVVCGALTILYTKHYMAEKREELIQQGEKIAQAYKKGYRTGNLSELSYELQILESYMGSGVLVINENGEVALASPGFNDEFLGDNRISQTLIERVQNGEIVSVQTKSGQVSDTPMLVVGYPFSEGHLAGILMCRSLPEIEESLKEMYQISVISLFFVSLLGLIVSYVTAKYVALPLMRMNRAAKVIANGNFEERVDVTSSDELGELAQSFNHMAESLQTHEKVQKDFIANISHDLRSPLTSMQGFLTAMLDGTIPVELQDKYLNIILFETERLTKLTQGILDLNQFGRHRGIMLDLADFDINRMIKTTILTFEGTCEKKGITFDLVLTGQELFVHADMSKIQQVLYNLIDNATKFSHQNSAIKIETSIKNEKVFISVKDSGIGIPADSIKKIWERFYKTDLSRGKDKKGTGLGLAIVKEIIQAHNEHINVISTEGVGTEFIFTLPLSQKEVQ